MGYGPIQWGSRCLAVVLRPVLVDLVARVVVGNHRHGLLKSGFLESRIIGPIYDAFPRKPLFLTQGAALPPTSRASTCGSCPKGAHAAPRR